MVKTLRITSIVAALLAIAVFAFPVLYGVKTDENIQKFLNSPGVIEKFRAISGNKIQTPANQVHPLVQQSQVFAKIINPPDPPAQPGTRGQNSGRTVVSTPPTLKPIFSVTTTSVCEAHPELSLALINEPGKGTSWVKQGSNVNHLLIEKIQDGLVIARNGEETFQVKTDEKKFTPVSFSGGRVVAGRGSSLPPKSIRGTTTVAPPPAPPVRNPVPLPVKTDSKTEYDPEKAKRVEDLVEKIRLVGSANNDSNNAALTPEEKAAQMQKLLSEFKNSNINVNDEEAKKLADLGEMLENMKRLSPDN